MMEVVAFSLLLVMSLSMMMSMALFKSRGVEHKLFALFSGSIAMVAIQNLSAPFIGPWQYLFALGTCATCSAMWLFSMSLFRGREYLKQHHYAIAILICLLVVLGYLMDMLRDFSIFESSTVNSFEIFMAEIKTLFSSTVLLLTVWEAFNGFRTAEPSAKKQRAIFGIGFFIGFFNTAILANAFVPDSLKPQVLPFFVATSAMIIVSSAFWVLLLRQKILKSEKYVGEDGDKSNNGSDDQQIVNESHQNLFSQIEKLMLEEKLFLNDDLKIRTVAQRLAVSDYKVGEAVRVGSDAANFSQFVNRYRIAHAKQLLKASKTNNVTILAVGLDSGFATIAPFNRAFKAMEGCTPNEYRKKLLV